MYYWIYGKNNIKYITNVLLNLQQKWYENIKEKCIIKFKKSKLIWKYKRNVLLN